MIRLALVSDVPAMLDIYAPYVLTTTHTFEYEVPTPEAFTARFERYTKQTPWLVWEENGRVLGYAYGSLPFSRAAYQWDCEVSIYLAPEVQGKGVGRQLYAVLEAILLRQGYRVIYSLITSENQGSIRFHEAVGYRTVAVLPDCGCKFGRWLGVIWMEKRPTIAEIPNHPPVSWREIVKFDGKSNYILDSFSLS